MTASVSDFSAINQHQVALLQEHFPAKTVLLSDGSTVVVRENRAPATAPVLLCLHGIGSGAASWLEMARLLAPAVRVIAWDAPGYGDSTPLATASPLATDYAKKLQQLVQALAIQSFDLVGHSLGALMAGAYVSLPQVKAPKSLTLISPAIGYGDPALAQRREQVIQHRLANWKGAVDMANRRATFLLSDQASTQAIAWVHWNMARLHTDGYKQAVWMLCHDDLLQYAAARAFSIPVHVWAGENDQITPLDRCDLVAKAYQTPLIPIPLVGHAVYVEQPEAVSSKIMSTLFKTLTLNMTKERQ